LKKMTHFIIAAALVLAAVVFKFFMRGYDYIGYTLVLAAVLVLLHRFTAGTALWKIIVALVVLGCMLFSFVEFFIIKEARTEQRGETKYLIVLGAAVHGDEMSLSLLRRIEGAYDFLELHPETTVIVSGGRGAGENISEAQAMRDWLVNEKNFPEERIIMEDKSTSTAENLEFSFAIIRERGDEPDGNTAVVSGGYHLFRAKTMAKMLGVGVSVVKARKGLPVSTVNSYIREVFGVVKLYVLGM